MRELPPGKDRLSMEVSKERSRWTNATETFTVNRLIVRARETTAALLLELGARTGG
jgi:hypothetical protein